MAPGIGFRTEMTFEYGVPRELAPGVNRLVAPNPSLYTFKGTNTYLLGDQNLAIIDPGPDDSAHVQAIVDAVAGRKVSHIFVTHRHRDHTGATAGLRSVIDAPVLAYGPATFAPPSDPASKGESIHRDLAVDILLSDGQTIAGDGWTLGVIHTPGHLSDHVCFQLHEHPALFSGDHVMGWNTSVIAPPNGSMSAYLNSLEKLRDNPTAEYFPGHGGRITEPRRTIKVLLLHRQWREQAILDALADGHNTIEKIVADVYMGLDDRLVRAASLSVQAHIEHLATRGQVLTVSTLTFEAEIIVVKP